MKPPVPIWVKSCPVALNSEIAIVISAVEALCRQALSILSLAGTAAFNPIVE